MVPGLFRVLDFDASGDIGTHEFLRGALLLLATVQGEARAGLRDRVVAMEAPRRGRNTWKMTSGILTVSEDFGG